MERLKQFVRNPRKRRRGYRLAHKDIAREWMKAGKALNHKRVYRLWRREGHSGSRLNRQFYKCVGWS